MEEIIEDEDTNSKEKNVMQSLTNIVDYIADIVSDKITQNITFNKINTNNGANIQNGFNSVKKAAESMANDNINVGGGNNKKFTRKRRY